MTTKRLLILVAVVLATSIGCYFVLNVKPDTSASRAYKAWGQGSTAQAHRALGEVWGEMPPAKRHLYRAYIHRDEGLLSASDQQLERALEMVGRRPDHLLIWEITLGQAINAFSNGEPKEGREPLQTARNLFPDHSYTLLLSGWEAYLQGNYRRAATLLNEPIVRDSTSEWLNSTIERHLPPSWRNLIVAHCMVEGGQEKGARKLIEQSGGSKEEVARLMALSYVHEAKYLSAEQALEMLHEAAPYLAINAPQKELFGCLSRFADKEMNAELFAEGMLLGSRYLDEDGDLIPLAKLAASYCLDQPENAYTLERRLANGPFRQMLAQEMEVASNWDLVRRFSNEPKLAARRVAARIQEELLDNIEDVEAAKKHIALLRELRPDRESQIELAEELVTYAHGMWTEGSKGKQAFEVMVLASSLLPEADQSHFREKAVAVLKHAYDRAKQRNNIEQLTLIYRAARFFRVEALDSDAKSEIANQMSDATYFMLTGNYAEAQKRAKWIVQLDPENHEAHRILGLTYYIQGNYHHALLELDPLNSEDGQIREITGICHLLIGDSAEGKRLLHTLAGERDLTDRSSLLLGYYLIGEQKPKEGAKWLEKIRNKDSEVCALLARCAFEEKKWSEALRYLSYCEEPYASHDGVRSLAALCYLALSQPDQAKLALEKQTAHVDPAMFSSLFQEVYAHESHLFQ